MSASPPPESQPIPSSRTWLSSPSPSSPTPSSPSPSSPSFTVLRIRLCFPPAASAATTPRYGDTQVVNMAFGHDFVPTPDVPLSLYVRRRGPVRSVYGDVDCLPQVTAYNLYTINQDVHIGRATNPTNPALDSASESSPSPAEFEADAEPETAQEAAGSRLLRANPPQATPLLLGAIALTLAAAVVVVLYLVVTPLLGRPLPCGGKMDETRTPPPVCKHKRAAPLTLFDDLAALLARRANAPLPLTVTAQAVIDQHYNASHGLSDPTRASTPITVFFVHLRETSAGLCDDTTDWALESKSPMLDDLVLLCSSIHDSLVDLPTRWLDTSGFMSFPYSYKSITAISTFVNALEQHAGTDAYADPSENNMLFYNTTSYAVIRSLKQTLFGGPGLAHLAHPVYDAIRITAALERELTDAHTRLLLFSSMVRDSLIPAARARQQAKASSSCSWMSGCRLKAARADLADSTPKYNRLLSLINTATTLVWIVAFTHQELGNVRDVLERLGNQTSALVATPPGSTAASSTTRPGCGLAHDRQQHAPAAPWVELGEGGATCTFWYLPPVQDIIATFKKVLGWCKREDGSSGQNFIWLCDAHQAWEW